MKTSLGIALALELMFALWFAYGPCNLNDGILQAGKALHENPSTLTARAELEHQGRLVAVQQLAVAAVAFGLISSPHPVAALIRRYQAGRARRLRATPTV
jgi:hypothetical protein